MGTKYSTVPITGYNATPPADDGTTTEANKVKWATIKTKLTDPFNTSVAAIDAALVLALNESATAVTTTYPVLVTDHLKTIQCTGTFTVSLGDAASMGAGYIVNIFNIGTGVITVSRATAGDKINGSAKDITLGPKEGATFKIITTLDGYLLIDGNTPMSDAADPSKQVSFVMSGITTGTRRGWTFPDAADTFVGLTATQTITNKTLTIADSTALTTPPTTQQIQKGALVYAADAGANDTYAITLSPAPAAYVNGMVVNFKANTANTGAATLNVNSLGAITIKKNNDQTLADNDIEAGQIVTVIYDGTNFQMQSQLANAAATTAASQAEMEAGTSNTVFGTPLNINWHQGVCKAFASITNSGGGVTVNTSYNMTSVTRDSTGIFPFNMATDFSTAEYTVCGSYNNSDSASNNKTVTFQGQAAGSVKINFGDGVGTAIDPAYKGTAIFLGDQA